MNFFFLLERLFFFFKNFSYFSFSSIFEVKEYFNFKSTLSKGGLCNKKYFGSKTINIFSLSVKVLWIYSVGIKYYLGETSLNSSRLFLLAAIPLIIYY